jgi:outer membrane protein TolC
MRRRIFLAVALLVGASATGAEPLTLQAARERALAAQPSLQALELMARASEEAAPAEAALPDPRVKLGAQNVPTRNFPTFTAEDMTQIVISYEQMVPGGDKRRLRGERMVAEAAQARAEIRGQREMIRRDAALAWLDAWQAVSAARAADELVQEYGRAIELATIGVASGRTPQAEVHGARQMQAQAIDRRLELAAQAERARAGLRRWVPDAGDFALPAQLPVWREPPAPAALVGSLERHPQHASLLGAQGVADADVAIAREASVPDKTFEVGYGFRQGMNRSDMIMLQVGFELPVWKAQKQDKVLESKLRLADRAREQRADQLRQLRSELDAAHAEWRIANERLVNFERSVLPAAKGRLDTLLAGQASGRAELAQIFDARRQLVEARLQELNLRTAQAKARVALEYFEHEGDVR